MLRGFLQIFVVLITHGTVHPFSLLEVFRVCSVPYNLQSELLFQIVYYEFLNKLCVVMMKIAIMVLFFIEAEQTLLFGFSYVELKIGKYTHRN